jgi:hypothetical protein
MGLSQKYGDCGCGQKTKGHQNYGKLGCCNGSLAAQKQLNCVGNVQGAPSECCEAHQIQYVTSLCFRPMTPIVASSEPFQLTFKNSEDIRPLNINTMFFYHAAAGFMRIVAYNGTSYSVELEDPTKANALIDEDDCVQLHQRADASSVIPSSTRCLAGIFTAPAVNGDAELPIFNGAGVPIGAILTFTYQGETGSYTVQGFVSAAGNIYVYTVQNTGSGLAVGTVVNAGDSGACTVPIEVISDVDICNLPEAQNVDSLAGCLNGSPRLIVPSGADSILVGNPAGDGWIQKRLSSTDCCVTTAGILKFSGATCPTGSDQVILVNENLQCFVDAFNKAQARNLHLPMMIGSTQVIVTAYNSGTRLATIALAADSTVSPPLEFPVGTQICLGSCCNSCTNGPLVSSPQDSGGNVHAAIINVSRLGGASIAYTNETSYWLVGFNNVDGSVITQKLDNAYFSNPDPTPLGLPRYSDAMILREKLCNVSDKGCNVLAEMQYNYQLNFGLLISDMTIDWELGHFAAPALTLADNTTPNPFHDFTTQAKASGRVQGVTAYDNAIVNSSFGSGNAGSGKMFPDFNGDFRDYIPLQKCNCALSILWLFFKITSPTHSGSMDVNCTIRRQMKVLDFNYTPLPLNSVVAQPFN